MGLNGVVALTVDGNFFSNFDGRRLNFRAFDSSRLFRENLGIGQYKTWAADCGLGIKHGLGIKCGLRTTLVKAVLIGSRSDKIRSKDR